MSLVSFAKLIRKNKEIEFQRRGTHSVASTVAPCRSRKPNQVSSGGKQICSNPLRGLELARKWASLNAGNQTVVVLAVQAWKGKLCGVRLNLPSGNNVADNYLM